MPTDRLQEIRARLDAATPGPWGYSSHAACCGELYVVGPDGSHIVHESYDPEGDRHNFCFIAHAPGDIAWLLDEVERLRANRPVRFPYGKPETGAF